MDYFAYRQGHLYCEAVAVEDIVREAGTPTYIYSRATLTEHYRRIAAAFAAVNPLICYSVKSCGNLALLRVLRELGSGFDVVSGGELFRVLQAGGEPGKIVFAGVGKTDQEINQALAADIGWFNIESEEEFWNLERLAAAQGRTVRGALRINPDISSRGTHRKTLTGKKETKFGVDIERAAELFEQARGASHARLTGLHLHIGSPILSPQPYVEAIGKVLALIEKVRGDPAIMLRQGRAAIDVRRRASLPDDVLHGHRFAIQAPLTIGKMVHSVFRGSHLGTRAARTVNQDSACGVPARPVDGLSTPNCPGFGWLFQIAWTIPGVRASLPGVWRPRLPRV